MMIWNCNNYSSFLFEGRNQTLFNTIKNLLFPPSNNSGTQDTTQDFVNIESIHENMIINKSGIAIMMIGLEGCNCLL